MECRLRQEAAGLGRQEAPRVTKGSYLSAQEPPNAQDSGLLPKLKSGPSRSTQRASQGDRLISKTDSGDYEGRPHVAERAYW